MALSESLERFKPPSYLLCPVCLEVFLHPKLLPCSHTLCGRCVSGLLEHSPPGTVTRHGVEPNQSVACPVCRGDLEKTQVGSLPVNRALEEAVADWKKRTDRERLVWIKGCVSHCATHDQDASLWCSCCKVNVCPDCCTEPSTSESEDHQKQPMDSFNEYCDERSRLINEYLVSRPRLVEIGECMRHTTKLQSEIMENYHTFVKDVGDLQSSIGDTLELKIVGVLADTNLKLKSLYSEHKEMHTKLVEGIERHTRCFTASFEPSSDVTLADLQNSREQLEQECEHACGEGQKALHQAHLDLRRSLALSLHKIARVKDILTSMEFIPRPFSAPSLRPVTTTASNASANTSMFTQTQPIPVRNTSNFSSTVLSTTAMLRAGLLRILPDGSVQYTNIPTAPPNPTDGTGPPVQAAGPQGNPVRFLQGALRPRSVYVSSLRPRGSPSSSVPGSFSAANFQRFTPASFLVRAPGFHNPDALPYSNPSHSAPTAAGYSPAMTQQLPAHAQSGFSGAGPVMPSPQQIHINNQTPGLFRSLANQFSGWTQQAPVVAYGRLPRPRFNQADQPNRRTPVQSPPARIIRFVHQPQPNQSDATVAMSPPNSPPRDHDYHAPPTSDLRGGSVSNTAEAADVSSSSPSPRRPRPAPRTRSRNGSGGNSGGRSSRNSRSRTNTNNNALFVDEDSNGSNASLDRNSTPLLPELDPLGIGAMEVVHDMPRDYNTSTLDNLPDFHTHTLDGLLGDSRVEQEMTTPNGVIGFHPGPVTNDDSEMASREVIEDLHQHVGDLMQYNYDSLYEMGVYNPPPIQRVDNDMSLFMDVSDDLDDRNS